MADFDRAVRRGRSATTWWWPSALPAQLLRHVRQLPVRFVADLYNPIVVEGLEAASRRARAAARTRRGAPDGADGDGPVRGGRLRHLREREAARPAGWAGWPGRAGRPAGLPPTTRPTARSSTWCPSGSRASAGTPTRPLRERLAGHRSRRQVLLWGGGIWRWLDALTADPRGAAPGGRGPRGAPGVPGRRPARSSAPGRFPPLPKRRSRWRASAAWRARMSTSTRAGSPTQNAKASCWRPTWVCRPTRPPRDALLLSHPDTRLPLGRAARRDDQGDAVGDLVSAEGLGTTVAAGDDGPSRRPARRCSTTLTAARRSAAEQSWWPTGCAGQRWPSR